LNCDTKDKILFKSLIDKCQPEQKLNSITGDDRRFESPPAAAKRNVVCILATLLSVATYQKDFQIVHVPCSVD
jgi:hypothetical protein